MDYKIDEKMLRHGIKGCPTSDFFSTVASKFLYKDIYGIEHSKHIIVYGKNTKTLAYSWRDGYKYNREIIAKFKGDKKQMYLDISETIDKLS